MLFLASVVALLLASVNASGGPLQDYIDKHSKSSGTQNNLKLDVTHASLPHLPMITGFFGTHATYRHVNVMEQTVWMIGEPKHALWRYQDNGFIRIYRKRGRVGLPDGVDPNNLASLTDLQKGIINTNYVAHNPDEKWDHYKYPDERISTGDGKFDTIKGSLNFLDVTIYHPKYGGKYESHVPIDLPLFYCTMSQGDYPHVYNSWKYATGQPLANKIGPLGIRAGLDIKEHYLNVVRFEMIGGAGVWANIGNGDPSGSDLKLKNYYSQPGFAQNVQYQKISLDHTNMEYYLVERPFYNVPYLFVIAVMEQKSGPAQYSYLRPDGAYWNELVKRNLVSTFNNKAAHYYPKVHVDNYPTVGSTSQQTMYPLPLYGTQLHNRTFHGLTGGSCPAKGGDFGRYPWGDPGAAFPTNYEEVGPICDAVVMDIHMYANLWAQTWNDPRLGLANSAVKKHVVDYDTDANAYGIHTDPYLVNKGETNPHAMILTKDGKTVGPSDAKPARVVLKLNYTLMGKVLDFNRVKGLKPHKPTCPAGPTCPPPKKCPTQGPVGNHDHDHPVSTDMPDWGSDIHTLVAVTLALVILTILIVLIFCFMAKGNKAEGGTVESGKPNPAYSSA